MILIWTVAYMSFLPSSCMKNTSWKYINDLPLTRISHSQEVGFNKSILQPYYQTRKESFL